MSGANVNDSGRRAEHKHGDIWTVYSDMEGRIENESLLYSRGEAFLKQQIGTP